MKPLEIIRRINGTPDDWVHRPIVIREGLCFYLNHDESLTPCEWTKQKDSRYNDEALLEDCLVHE